VIRSENFWEVSLEAAIL